MDVTSKDLPNVAGVSYNHIHITSSRSRSWFTTTHASWPMSLSWWRSLISSVVCCICLTPPPLPQEQIGLIVSLESLSIVVDVSAYLSSCSSSSLLIIYHLVTIFHRVLAIFVFIIYLHSLAWCIHKICWCSLLRKFTALSQRERSNLFRFVFFVFSLINTTLEV